MVKTLLTSDARLAMLFAVVVRECLPKWLYIVNDAVPAGTISADMLTFSERTERKFLCICLTGRD